MVSNAKNRLVNALNKLVKKEIKSADIKKPNIGFINKEAAKKQLEIA